MMSAFLLFFNSPIAGGGPPPDLRGVRMGTFDASQPEREFANSGLVGPKYLYFGDGKVEWNGFFNSWFYYDNVGNVLAQSDPGDTAYPWMSTWPSPFYADAINV